MWQHWVKGGSSQSSWRFALTAMLTAPKPISHLNDFWEFLFLKWTLIQLTKLPFHSINQSREHADFLQSHLLGLLFPWGVWDDCWPLYFASILAYLERKMERVQKTGPLMPLGRTRLPPPSQRLFHITTSRDRNGGKFEKACTAPRQKRRLITDRGNASGSGRGREREACLAIMASFAH